MASLERYLNRGTERSVAISPLLNLAPAASTGATMKHNVAIVALGGSGISGRAQLILTPDRRTVKVEVTLERPRPVSVDLRRVEADGEEDLLILEIVAGGPFGQKLCRGRRFELDRSPGFAAFANRQDLAEAGLFLSSGRAESVEGIAVEPARRSGSGSYFAERMLNEIAAAEGSASAVAASRHVELATLYARHLRSAQSPSP
jgi:hypothetical protein